MAFPKDCVVTIVVNFNMGSMVERCLLSLQLRDEADFVHHVVVWENGSERALFGNPLGSEWQLGDTKVFYTGGHGNLGYARAVNAAYRSWRERNSLEPIAIHCANPDTVSEPDALSNLVAAIRDRGWGAAAPLVTFEDGSSRPAAYPPLTPALVVGHFLRLRWMRRFGRRFAHTTGPREIQGAVDGAYIVFACDAWNAVGGMDGLFGISADDHDICARLKSAGWKIGVVPSSRISHHGARGRKETPLLSQLDGVQGYVRYVSKHYPKKLSAVRYGIWLLLRFRREPLSKELAWWARRAPVQIEPVSSDMEENYRQVLMSFNDRPAAVLSSRLQSEWWRRQSRPKGRAEINNQ